MEKIYPILGYSGRTLLGFALAILLGALGVGIGRGVMLFFGLISVEAMFFLLMAGAGIGAGVGSLMAWLWLKHSGRVFAVTLLLLGILAGAIGGWGGYSYGAGYDWGCCARPDMGSEAFTILGATAGANLMALSVVVIGHLILGSRRRIQIHTRS